MNNFNNRRRRFFPFFLLIIPFVLAMGLAVMLLWNYTIAAATGAHEIQYGQALGLLVLSRILFGGGPRKHWARKADERMQWREKWMGMSDEERAKFKEEWRNRRCRPNNDVPPPAAD